MQASRQAGTPGKLVGNITHIIAGCELYIYKHIIYTCREKKRCPAGGGTEVEQN